MWLLKALVGCAVLCLVLRFRSLLYAAAIWILEREWLFYKTNRIFVSCLVDNKSSTSVALKLVSQCPMLVGYRAQNSECHRPETRFNVKPICRTTIAQKNSHYHEQETQMVGFVSQKNTSLVVWHYFAQVYFGESLRRVLPEHLVKFERQVLFAEDGASFTLEWFPSRNVDPGKPLVFLLHGVNGSHNSYYIQHLIQLISVYKQQYNVCVMVRRGCAADYPLTTPYLADDANDLHDLEMAIEEVKKAHRGHIYAVGFSFGGIQLIKSLCLRNTEHPFRACIFISVPYCLHELSANFKRFPASLANKFSTKLIIKNHIIRHEAQLANNSALDLDKIRTLTTSDEYDTHVTLLAHRRKYDSIEQMREQASAKKYLYKVVTPLPSLCISAADDPLCPETIVDAVTNFNRNENLVFVKTEKGAHCLFFDHVTNYLKTTWLEEAILEYIEACEREPTADLR